MTETFLDRLLDRTVVGGYTNLGYLARRRHWAGDPAPDSLRGKRALVTGAGSGLGKATARELARLGATVHLLGRSAERVRPAIEEILHDLHDLAGATTEDRLVAEACDVSDLDAVRSFARDLNARLAADDAALDVLVHNAGSLPESREVSRQGHELTVATHVLGPFLMSDLLVPALRRSREGARLVLVSSGGMYSQPLPVDDPDFTEGTYRGAVAYARSKRIQVDLTPLLADRMAPHGITVSCMHPGWADTPGVASSLPVFRAVTGPLLRSSEQGADTIVWLSATDPAPESGLFWHDRVPRPTTYGPRRPSSAADRARLLAWVDEATAANS